MQSGHSAGLLNSTFESNNHRKFRCHCKTLGLQVSVDEADTDF